MQRKIIKQGAGGYTIYLPKKWVERKGLRQGDLVDVREETGTITIDTPTRQKTEVHAVFTDETETDIRNTLTHHYRTGVDAMRITYTTERQKIQVQQVTDSLLLGFEVTEHHDKWLLLENVSEPSGDRYDVLLRRIFLLIFETHDAIAKDADAAKAVRRSEIEEYRRQQDEFVLFCRRAIQKDKYARDPLLHWELLTFLMHIEHAYAYLHARIERKKERLSPQATALLQGLRQYGTLLYDAYYQRDAEQVHRMNDPSTMPHFTTCYDALAASKGEECIIIAHIREIYRLMQIGSSPVLAMILRGEHAVSEERTTTS